MREEVVVLSVWLEEYLANFSKFLVAVVHSKDSEW